MLLGLGIGLIKRISKILEYIPTGFDGFITSDGEKFITSDGEDFNVVEP